MHLTLIIYEIIPRKLSTRTEYLCFGIGVKLWQRSLVQEEREPDLWSGFDVYFRALQEHDSIWKILQQEVRLSHIHDKKHFIMCFCNSPNR